MPVTLKHVVKRGLIGNEWSVPTIYIDPETGKEVSDDNITVIGAVSLSGDDQTLPPNIKVLCIGSKVRAASYIDISDGLPENLLKGAVNLADISSLFVVSGHRYGYDDNSPNKLDYIPEGLFDNCVNLECVHSAFRHAEIREIPEGLFKNCPKIYNVAGLFEDCKYLRYIPADLFSYCPKLRMANGVFRNCESLTEIPVGLFKNNKKLQALGEAFVYCKSLQKIPSDIFAYSPDLDQLPHVFARCTALQEVPQGLLSNITNESMKRFDGMFEDCFSLRYVPEDLFKDLRGILYMVQCFANCLNLRGQSPKAPDGKMLWNRSGKGNGPRGDDGNYLRNCSDYSIPNGYQCFAGCTHLDDYNAIPESWR